ncbi:sodium-dependent inner membrane transport protein [Neisseria meningitidis]|nr:sodium-dependent inner membrane transport protein [Neisseria meningitidis]
MAGPEALGLDFVGKVAGPLAGVWVFTAAIMALGVQKGVARASSFFMPLLW